MEMFEFQKGANGTHNKYIMNFYSS